MQLTTYNFICRLSLVSFVTSLSFLRKQLLFQLLKFCIHLVLHVFCIKGSLAKFGETEALVTNCCCLGGGGGQFQVNHKLTFGYRCLHGISNLLTVCRVPIETKGHLEVHNPWKLVPISNQLCDVYVYIKLFVFLCLAFAVRLEWCLVTICSWMLNLSEDVKLLLTVFIQLHF